MSKRSMVMSGLVGVAAALCVAGLLGTGRGQPEDRHGREESAAGRYAVVIPQAHYQMIVVSPEATGVAAAGTPIRFTIRTRDKASAVSDFPFFVRAGDLRTIDFPEGWGPTGESFLMTVENVSFAAWGVGISAGPNGTLSPGPMIRFEPVERDRDRDARNRERERDFEALLREVERNR